MPIAPQIFELLHLDPSDVYADVLNGYAAVDDIVRKIQEMSDLWEKELVYAMAYDCWRANKQPVNTTQRELLEQENYREPDVEGKRPKCLAIFDDMSHSQLFSSSRTNPFVSFLLRHRHVAQVGLSVFLCLQNFKGLTRSLRLNTTQFCLWKTCDLTEQKAIFDEVASVCSFEDFCAMCSFAWQDEHSFLFVDLNAGSDIRKVFRKNFDEPCWPGHPALIESIDIRKASAKDGERAVGDSEEEV